MRVLAACRAFWTALVASSPDEAGAPQPPPRAYTTIDAIDLRPGHLARVLMSSGAILPITNMLDAENDQTAVRADATAVVAGNNELWVGGIVAALPSWPTVH